MRQKEGEEDDHHDDISWVFKTRSNSVQFVDDD
jgi:hypothetical protein